MTQMYRFSEYFYLFIWVFRGRQLSKRSLWDNQEVNWGLWTDVVKSYTLMKTINPLIHFYHIICVSMLKTLSYTGDTCSRNLHRIECSSICCKFLAAATFKHSRSIKPHNFGHVHRCKFLVQVSWACVTRSHLLVMYQN